MMHSSSSSSPPPIMYSSGGLETSSFLHPPPSLKRRRRNARPLTRKLCWTKCLISSPMVLLVVWSCCLLFRSNPPSTNPYTTTSSHNNNNGQPASVQQQATYALKQALLQKKKKKTKSVLLTNNNDPNIVVVRPRPKQWQEDTADALQASQEGVAGTQYVEGATLQQQQQHHVIPPQGNVVGMQVAVTNHVPRNGGIAVSQDDETAAASNVYKRVQGRAVLRNPQQGALQETNTRTIVVSENVPLSYVQGQQAVLMNDNGVSETVPLSNVQGQQAVLMNDNGVSDNVPLSNVQGQQAVLMNDNGVSDNAPLSNVQGQQAVLMNDNGVSDNAPLSNVQGQQAVLMNPQASVLTKTRIMYYDASSRGIPETVYDESGKAYLLSSLEKEGTDIYMERPATQQQEEEEETNPLREEALETLPHELVPPVQTLDMPQSWGRSKSQDQFIVIATVATMALLVGALSARKLRVANFLNSCIENEETLQNEYMYDAAYTTNGYDTFGGGPSWKGDLEKFDV